MIANLWMYFRPIGTPNNCVASDRLRLARANQLVAHSIFAYAPFRCITSKQSIRCQDYETFPAPFYRRPHRLLPTPVYYRINIERMPLNHADPSTSPKKTRINLLPNRPSHQFRPLYRDVVDAVFHPLCLAYRQEALGNRQRLGPPLVSFRR